VASAAALRRRIRSPRGHWALLALFLAALLVALLLNGYASRVEGSGTQPRGHGDLAGLPATAAILDLSAAEPRSVAPPRRTVALTFEDGPDRKWTPRVLDVLRRHGVRATFFVVGSRVAAHPEVVRRALREGHEIGSHTFTHADLASVPAWRANVELRLTQSALAGAIGRSAALLRIPYSSTPSAFTAAQLAAGRFAAAQGYLVVVGSRDGEDWRGRRATEIVSNALPSGGEGAVVVLHDGGGDREQTVAALARLVERLKAKRYRFTTVSRLADLHPDDTMEPVARLEKAHGVALIWALRGASGAAHVLEVLLIPIAALAILRGFLLLGFAYRHKKRRRREGGPQLTPPVSVVVPAFNEEVGIARAIRSFSENDYPELEIIVVDDGSTDRTAEVVERLADPKVTLVRQPNLGKARALETGIARAAHPIIVTVDGDTLFEPDTVRALVQPFRDPAVGAVSGNTKVGNRKGLLGKCQHIEYVMGFNLDRRMLDIFECMPTVPGAIGAFRREALAAAGGFADDTLAEDTDITISISRAGWRVVYEESARAWTEAPATLSALWRQRYRWSYGTLQCLWKHRAAVWPFGDARVGRAFPYLLVFDIVVPMLTPFIDVYVLYALAFGEGSSVLGYWVAITAVHLATGIYAFRLDGERLRPLWTVPLQQFVQRQLMYLVIIQSVSSALLGIRLRWHKLVRTGEVDVGA
jgi:cellulose synthase/poly-beta-1,6-N-acetylglucosamine synthase-like glycosyltransferase/peptidoglycan/xylan/chitin deacetylase (PgdA/CDA1 family)